METTTLTYSNNFYNNLTDIHEAHTWAMTEKSQKILDSMMEINKLNVFGVCRLHKHFILKENECVVTSKTPEGYLAQVKPYSAKFYPWIWRFVAEQSAWVPTEFFEVPEAQISEVEDGESNQSFMGAAPLRVMVMITCLNVSCVHPLHRSEKHSGMHG